MYDVDIRKLVGWQNPKYQLSYSWIVHLKYVTFLARHSHYYILLCTLP